MKCPVCVTAELKMSERQGVEIDYCPECRGIWLDRGELDKIIERSYTQYSQPQQPPPQPPQQQAYPQYAGENHQSNPFQKRHHDEHNPFSKGHHDKHYDKHHEQHHDSHGYHRKKSWLADIFD